MEPTLAPGTEPDEESPGHHADTAARRVVTTLFSPPLTDQALGNRWGWGVSGGGPLSSATLDLVAGLVRGHLKKIRSRWRKLPPGRIALIVLAVLRHDQRLSDIAGGNDVSASTVRRWLLEVIELLSARAPRLDRARKNGSSSCSTAPSSTPADAPGIGTGRTIRANTRPTACCSSP
ncbi:hypothetical protein AB0G71_25825 [Streptomyces sp. NPDC020403]|uniref:hypothetical protein n=1 Tax=unclassified Streptomyces TaxID=2593676 RepID=UPI0033E9A733